ncbi:MAG: DUF3786 domain-containing protein [Peptococcaceae bacterium]|jgi:hypothetical protein|nr:DUF3786 domain-containing protein [Peptococcaceae bacterium]
MANGYEQIYQSIIHKLAECDFGEAADRLGLAPPINGLVHMLFLGRAYEISAAGVAAPDGLATDPNIRSILVYYITSKGKAEPSYSYSFLHRFISGPLGGQGISWMTAPLVREFGNDYPKFCGAMMSLGATYERSPSISEHIWSYRILPKIPMQIVYVEADDEFPCEIQLKLDDVAGQFMEFEQLAFLCGCLVHKLSQIGKTGAA